MHTAKSKDNKALLLVAWACILWGAFGGTYWLFCFGIVFLIVAWFTS